jgi:hypothetical protein
MGKTNKKNFTHITINKKLKQELDLLKETVRKELGVTRIIWCPDVINFLINHYRNSSKVEFLLNQKLLVGNKLEKENLSVAIPVTPKPFRPFYELDEKTRASYFVES